MSLARSTCAAVIVSLLAPACRTPATQVDLDVVSSCPERTDRQVELAYFDGAGAEVHPTETVAVSTSGWPIRRRLTPRGQDASRTWRVDARLLDVGGGELARDSLGGGYVAGTTSPRTLRLADPGCGDSGLPDVDAGPVDAGVRSTDGLLLAYDFAAPTPGAECVQGYDLSLAAATLGDRTDGLELTGGHAVTARLPTEVLTQMVEGFSVEAWFEVGSLAAPGTDPLKILGFYDTTTFYNTLRLSLGNDEAMEFGFVDVLAGVSTDATGDGYARPFLAGRVSRVTPIHAVHTYQGTMTDGTEHLYINGREVAARWRVDPYMQAPRVGRPSFGRHPGSALWLGNHAHYSQRRVDADVGAPLDAGEEPYEAAAEAGSQFVGTYHLVAIYGRVLTPAEVAAHFALGSDARPCPRP